MPKLQKIFCGRRPAIRFHLLRNRRERSNRGETRKRCPVEARPCSRIQRYQVRMGWRAELPRRRRARPASWPSGAGASPSKIREPALNQSRSPASRPRKIFEEFCNNPKPARLTSSEQRFQNVDRFSRSHGAGSLRPRSLGAASRGDDPHRALCAGRLRSRGAARGVRITALAPGVAPLAGGSGQGDPGSARVTSYRLRVGRATGAAAFPSGQAARQPSWVTLPWAGCCGSVARSSSAAPPARN